MPHPPLSARDASGFTLVELVAAIVISSIVILVVFQLLASQGRLAQLQSAREEVQHNARSFLELITSELRSSDPRGISAAEANSITFRSARAWGVVCSHTPARLSAFFASAATAALRTGEEFLAIPPVAGATEWQFLEVSDLSGSSAERAQARADCEQMGVSVPVGTGSASRARMYAARADAPSAQPLGLAAGAPGLAPGVAIYVYDDVRYQIARPTGMADWWIRRNTGPAMSMHPLVGPVAESRGLHFRYFDAAGQEISEAALRTQTRRIEVTVITHSRARFGGHPLRDSASAAVFLRNQE